MNLRNISVVLASLAPLAALAQYNPSIEVEGEYKPDIIAQERINTFPQPLRTGNLDSRLEYDLQGIVTDFQPQGVPMEATGWGDSRRTNHRRGWLDLALGSWLDARLSAGYRFLNSESTLAQLWLNHNSTSLWKPLKDQQYGTSDWHRYLYDETLGFDLRHIFSGKGILSANVSWNFADFNYYSSLANLPDIAAEKSPSQQFNDARVAVSWQSTGSRGFLPYASLGLRFVDFRRLYDNPLSPDENLNYKNPGVDGIPPHIQGEKETALDLRFGFDWKFNAYSSLTVDLAGTGVFTAGLHDSRRNTDFCPADYGIATIKAYYRLNKGIIDFHIGPRLDMAFRTGWNQYPNGIGPSVMTKQNSEFKNERFYVSPDAGISLKTSKFSADLSVTGGARLHTLGSSHDMNFYSQPAVLNTTPEHSPMDAQLRLGIGPFAGFHAELKAGYRLAGCQRLGGWYACNLAGFDPGNQAKDPASGLAVVNTYCSDDDLYNAHGGTIGLKLSYEYSPYIGISAEGNWQPQKPKNEIGYFNGYDLPEITGRASIWSNPWSRLELGLDFDLRARRGAVYSIYGFTDAPRSEYRRMKLDDWYNLSFHASYGITESMRVGVELNNLLNRRQEILPGLPVPGITAAATFSWNF